MAYPRHMKDPNAHAEVLQGLHNELLTAMDDRLQPATTISAGTVLLATQDTASELKDSKKALTAYSIGPIIQAIRTELKEIKPLFKKVIEFKKNAVWDVPEETEIISITLKAGDGGSGGYGGGGGGGGIGGGGEMKTVLAHVKPGDTLNITIGKRGTNGENGGGPGENEGGSGGGGGAGGENTLVMLGDKVLSSTVGGGGGGGGGGRTIKNTGNGGRGGDGGGCGGYAGGDGKAGQHYNSNMQTIAGGLGGAGKAGGASSAFGGGIGGTDVGRGGFGMGVPRINLAPTDGYVIIHY